MDLMKDQDTLNPGEQIFHNISNLALLMTNDDHDEHNRHLTI
jgi:hypothetical protein